VNVRPATPDDLPRIVAMGRKFWSQTAYAPHVIYCPDSIAGSALQMMDTGLLLVADVDGVAVGAVGLMTTPLYANRDVLAAAELYWYVEPEHRDNGAGRALLAAIENAARDAGVKVLGMMALEAVEPDKAAAIYKLMGYVPAERTFLKVL
jgi:GNAT superfamily N-acetyltransferase